MKVQKLDRQGYITHAMNALGYKIDFQTVEIFLNVAKHIEKNGDTTTIKDIVQIEAMTKKLFDDEKSK